MESSLNYPAFEIKTKMVDPLPWRQQTLVDQKLCKVNFNGLTIQLEQIVWTVSSIF